MHKTKKKFRETEEPEIKAASNKAFETAPEMDIFVIVSCTLIVSVARIVPFFAILQMQASM